MNVKVFSQFLPNKSLYIYQFHFFHSNYLFKFLFFCFNYRLTISTLKSTIVNFRACSSLSNRNEIKKMIRLKLGKRKP